MLIETVRSRLLYRSLDAVVTAPLRPSRPFKAHVRSMLSVHSSNYDRMGSLMSMVDALAPGTVRRAGHLICRPVNLPFPADHIEPFAYGSGSTVFLVHDGDRRRVLKIYRRSLGLRPERLRTLIMTYRTKYEAVRSWYEQVPELVWPAEFMVLPGPILGRPAIACVQDYLDGEIRDFFLGFDNGDLLAVLRSNDPLRDQFRRFARRTLEGVRTLGRCPDFLGENNLAVVGAGPERRLRLIDYGFIELAAGRGRNPAIRGRIKECLDRIRSLAAGCAEEDRAGGGEG